jgi:hypothetical protein
MAYASDEVGSLSRVPLSGSFGQVFPTVSKALSCPRDGRDRLIDSMGLKLALNLIIGKRMVVFEDSFNVRLLNSRQLSRAPLVGGVECESPGFRQSLLGAPYCCLADFQDL